MRNVSSRIAAQDRMTEDAGFIRGIDREAARRQFNMSLGLVLALSLATLASVLTLRIEPGAKARETDRITVQAPQFVPVLQAGARSVQQPGG